MTKTKFFKSALQSLSLLAALLLFAQSSLATTGRLLSDERLILTSRLVLTGNVQAVQSQWDKNRQNIHTYVTVQISEMLKGQVQNYYVVLKQEGGVVGGDEVRIDGAPKYQVGQQVLLFLNTLPDGALTVAYLFQGKYDIVSDAQTGQLLAQRTIDGDNVHLLPGQDAQVTNRAELSGFIEKIRSTVRYQTKTASIFERSYSGTDIREIPSEYKNSVGDTSAKDDTPAEFTFNQGGIRWFTTGVSYLVNPNGAPVSGGGITEFQQGAAAWTNVGTSNISLIYSGTTTRVASSNPNDGFNVISYAPLQADNSSCSGVGAITFTRSISTQTTFVNGRAFKRLLEADIVVNSQFPCFLGVSENLAYIFAHELGHSIGLGHSLLTTAAPGTPPIMAEAAPGGRGATLGMDDVNGVSFIYPQPGLNPIDEQRYFVGQQYRDFLNREPDVSGWDFWTGTINECGGDATCIDNKRVDVVRAFFYSTEFLDQHPGLRNPPESSPDFNNAEFIRICYLVFLRRNVDSSDGGYQFWLNDLNSNNDYNHIIRAFLYSTDYRNRQFLFYGIDQ